MSATPKMPTFAERVQLTRQIVERQRALADEMDGVVNWRTPLPHAEAAERLQHCLDESREITTMLRRLRDIAVVDACEHRVEPAVLARRLSITRTAVRKIRAGTLARLGIAAFVLEVLDRFNVTTASSRE